MTSRFLIDAKTGLIGLHAPHSRVSNQGGIVSIRDRMKGIQPGGFPKYAMLGSQNAIPGSAYEMEMEHERKNNEDLAKRIADDISKLIPQPSETPASSKPILPGQTRKESLLGGSGGKQSEASKEAAEERKREEAKEPSATPPFDLSTSQGKTELKAYGQYLLERYGKESARVKIDDVEKDSQGFTTALKAYREINKEINAFNKDDARRWTQWARNIIVEYGDRIIDALGSAVSTPQTAVAVEGVKKILKEFKPKDAQDFVGSMKQLQEKLLEGKPEWKKKITLINKQEFDAWSKQIQKEIGIDTDRINRAIG
jgi:hypothetical protein